jgi:hypothetical protein
MEIELKICKKCSKSKPINDFAKHTLRADGRQSGCRECRAKYDFNHYKEKYTKYRDLIDTIKLKKGCIDCGYNSHPEALEFDHRNPSLKTLNISSCYSRKLSIVMDEIEKCDVRCANCHAVKTKRNREFGRQI